MSGQKASMRHLSFRRDHNLAAPGGSTRPQRLFIDEL